MGTYTTFQKLPTIMLFKAISAAALLPAAFAAPLAARQAATSSLSGSLTEPMENASVERGTAGLLNVTYMPGPQTSWIDVELLSQSGDDDDLDSNTIVENWAPSGNGTEMMASFKLAGDDYDVPSGDDDDGIACDATVYLRVTEYQLTGNNVRTVRGSRVPVTLGCPAGAAATGSSGNDNNDDDDDNDNDNEED